MIQINCWNQKLHYPVPFTEKSERSKNIIFVTGSDAAMTHSRDIEQGDRDCYISSELLLNVGK